MPKSPLLSRILVWILELGKWYQGIHRRLWRNSVNLKQLNGTVPPKPTDSTPGHHLASKTTKDAPNPTETQFDPTLTTASNARTLSQLPFWSTKAAFHGYIQEPEGAPARGGSHGDVWCCEARFRTQPDRPPTKVAFKVLRYRQRNSTTDTPRDKEMLQRFQQEGITWSGLLDHPNILPLIGWTLAPNLAFISPWCEQGSLYDRLEQLSELERMKLPLGIAKGLEYLHSCNPPVVHGDLKPDNILISDDGEPLLADFGLSTIVGEEEMYTSSHREGFSFPWMAPECMNGSARSCQSDIYSFGSLTFAVVTGKLPYAGLTIGKIILKVCDPDDPKDPIENWSDYPQLHGLIVDLLKDCWLRLPEPRPSISTVVERLSTRLLLHKSETAIHPSPSAN